MTCCTKKNMYRSCPNLLNETKDRISFWCGFSTLCTGWSRTEMWTRLFDCSLSREQLLPLQAYNLSLGEKMETFNFNLWLMWLLWANSLSEQHHGPLFNQESPSLSWQTERETLKLYCIRNQWMYWILASIYSWLTLHVA